MEKFFLVEPPQEGGYIAKAITHAVFKQADTLEQLRENIKDAVQCHIGNA